MPYLFLRNRYDPHQILASSAVVHPFAAQGNRVNFSGGEETDEDVVVP